MNTYTDRQKACIESPLKVMERLTREFNAMSEFERAVHFDMMKREREKIESTSPIPGEPDGGAASDARTELEVKASLWDEVRLICVPHGAGVDKPITEWLEERLAAPSQPAAPATAAHAGATDRESFEQAAQEYPYDLTWTKFGHYAKRETQHAFLMFKSGVKSDAAPTPVADSRATLTDEQIHETASSYMEADTGMYVSFLPSSLEKFARALLAAAKPVSVDAGSGMTHPDDIAVDAFALRMKAKMAASRAKGRSGWDDPTRCDVEDFGWMLIQHIGKGDPVDIANFAMMLSMRDAPNSVLSDTWFRFVQSIWPERGDTELLTYPAEFTDDLEWILGLICFQCIEYARALRKGGHDIPNKAEAEQAHTLDWLLRHYMRDPANWRKNAADEARSFMAPPTESTGEPT